jgi:DNA gyrase/topoisomerase IV subunit B
MAGKTGRQPCYLLATEGDSAKDLAVCGMEIVGRDHYGVIPLRGVIRNVRPAKVNAKVTALTQLYLPTTYVHGGCKQGCSSITYKQCF